jgi:hypothetical protein
MQQSHFHAPFFDCALDRLHDHILGGRRQNESNALALFQNSKPIPLQAGRLPRDRARVRHHLVDRLRRLGVGREARRGIRILLCPKQ